MNGMSEKELEEYREILKDYFEPIEGFEYYVDPLASDLWGACIFYTCGNASGSVGEDDEYIYAFSHIRTHEKAVDELKTHNKFSGCTGFEFYEYPSPGAKRTKECTVYQDPILLIKCEKGL